MHHAVILSGVGRYADPWHPFAETSRALAQVAADAGLDPEIVTDTDAALAQWTTAALPDLVIVNLGRPDPSDSAQARQAAAGLERLLLEAPILALHTAANCFPDSETWEQEIGGRWLPETSWHPPHGPITCVREPQVSDATLRALGEGIERFDVEDERYLDLRLGADRHVLYTHPDEQGGRAPTIWARTGATGKRRVYDALGHDARSYQSATHTELLGRLMTWLLDENPRPAQTES